MTDGASYAPPGPGTEAAIEVEFSVPEGKAHFRIPFSAFSEVFHTVSDSREDMFRTFSNPKLGIWLRLFEKRALMVVGEVYTVTAEDLSLGENLNR